MSYRYTTQDVKDVLVRNQPKKNKFGAKMKYIHRIWLFLRIVWRPWDDDYRLPWLCAWEVSRIVWE